MELAAILERYRVDLAHARRVADHALALFDAVADRYDLPAGARPLLEAGALLHNVGLTTDPASHHLVGRDIVLRHPIDGLGERERATAAAMVAFHRRRVRPRQEPAFLALRNADRRLALRLSAILRVADGLDYSQSQTTSFEGLVECPGGLAMRLGGELSGLDGLRAVAKADLWAKSFGEALSAEGADGAALPLPPEQPAGAGEAEAATLAPWYAAPTAPLAELGRVLLRRHLRRMLRATRAVRANRGAEAVHELRVATRRLRATMRLVAPVGPGRKLREHGRAVAALARAAGAVRDRDVLLGDLAARAEAMPAELQPSAAALRAALEAERRAAHAALIAHLDGDAHERSVQQLAALICRGHGWDDGPRVRDLGGSILWRHYEALRAHDRGGLPRDEEQLHEMRIEGKRLRYVLELFGDTLGPRVDEAAAPLVAFQDHLGGLNDAAVARAALAPHARDGETLPAAAAYLALRDEQAQRLRAELPARWDKLSSATYRRRLLELVVKL
jgi:CHAD domain-containing protein